jgi:hypothetical protein
MAIISLCLIGLGLLLTVEGALNGSKYDCWLVVVGLILAVLGVLCTLSLVL